MTIIIKNKETLLIDDFKFRCSVGKNGFSRNKKEGDNKTPIGIFNLGNIYYREDRIIKPISKLKKIKIKSITFLHSKKKRLRISQNTAIRTRT